MTPEVTDADVACVMSGLLLYHAEAWSGIQVRETVLRLEDFHYADEVFLCNALIGIWPVRRFEGRTYALGPITRRLMAALRAAQDAWTNDVTKADAHELKLIPN